MKNSIIAILLLLAFCSCSSENEVSQSDLHEVRLNVSSLNIKDESMTRTAKTVKETLSEIYYSVINTSTKKEYKGSQELSKLGDGFGNITLWLPSGTYDVYVMGAGKMNPSGEAYMYTTKDYQTHNIVVKNKDSFFNKQSLSISTETQNVNIELSRLNAALVLKLNDDLPDEVAKVKMKMFYYPIWMVEGNKAIFEGNTGMASTFKDELSLSGKKINEYTCYVLPQEKISVFLSICDSQDIELGTTKVEVSFFKNRRTIIEGKLLDVIHGRPLNITVSDVWGDDNVIPLK